MKPEKNEELKEHLSGKVAVVTGAGSGLGRNCALALGRLGARVAVSDLDPAAAQATADSIIAAGGIARADECDTGRVEHIERMFAAIRADWGGVDILINNAGAASMRFMASFEDMPREDLRKMFDVNVMGVIECTLAAKASMATRGGGAIVNLSSVAGYMLDMPYGVTKLAVRGLTATFAHELGKYNIRVNAIAPGMMATENSLGTAHEDMWAYARTIQKIARRGEMEDITDLALFLVGPHSTFITGETIRCSGGAFLSAG